MLQIKYNLEASNYILDGDELTRELMIAVETLAFTAGIPVHDEHYELPDLMHVWHVMGHIVVYDVIGDLLTV